MKGRVLIADDEDDVRLMLRVALSRRGWDIEEALTASSALDVCRREPPDVLILDQRIPWLRGMTAARLLREEGFKRPIVLFSAYLTPELEQEARSLDVVAVGKADIDELIDAVERAAEADGNSEGSM